MCTFASVRPPSTCLLYTSIQYDGQSYGDDDAVTATIVKGQSVAAIQVLSDLSPTGDKPGDDTFTNCSISGVVLDNATNYHLTFRS